MQVALILWESDTFHHKVIENNKRRKQWQQWQKSCMGQMLLCSTLVEAHEISTQPKDSDGFNVVGLASLTQAMEQADQTVELT